MSKLIGMGVFRNGQANEGQLGGVWAEPETMQILSQVFDGRDKSNDAEAELSQIVAWVSFELTREYDFSFGKLAVRQVRFKARRHLSSCVTATVAANSMQRKRRIIGILLEIVVLRHGKS